ncbi:GNAT family N-acetyltransferase [Geodermatophilus nigrescens]|uniref:Predicted acetyltransferase n=1 Tax=Geodermatophilus nigrescens TaxID=1070870 RepID=A0A1M5FGQ6_9ACTN|nr:GNAT family N-acetyltransferase [Geodermatophilus nigrescens]SHF90342.1 Predicted acetyltransferase [Geodermatophilus nigrescens]
MTDPADLRPVTAEEWPAFSRAMLEVFGDEPIDDFTEKVPATAELDRSLSLWSADGRVAATAGLYSRQLTVPGAVVPCAGVTWVTVSPTHRRRGVLTAVMRRQLTELHEQEREPLAALWASEGSIYGRFGYAPATLRGNWRGSTRRLGFRPGVDVGTGTVAPADADTYLAGASGVAEALRRWVPGVLDRDERWWRRSLRDPAGRRNGASALRFLLHREADGEVTGHAAYRVRSRWTDDGEADGTVLVDDVRARSTAGYAALWRYLLDLDLVRSAEFGYGPVDDPLRHLLADPRALHTRPLDGLWLRLVDVGRALAARRYPAPIDMVLEVRDPFCPWNDGRWWLRGHPAGAFCAPSEGDPDLVVDVDALAAAYLGGTSLGTLQAAGRVTEVSPGAVTQAATAFSWPVTPWCNDQF